MKLIHLSFFCLLSLIQLIASLKAVASTNQVIFLSPTKAYFISNQGKENGYYGGKDVCFDDPKVGRITCARVYMSTPTASAYVLLSKFSEYVTLNTKITPLRWRVKNRQYNKQPNSDDIQYLKNKLSHLDSDTISQTAIANSTKSQIEKQGQTAKGLNEGSDLEVLQAQLEQEREKKKISPRSSLR